MVGVEWGWVHCLIMPSNWVIAFFISSLDSKLGFLNVGLGLYFKLVVIHTSIKNQDLLMLL